MATTLTYTTQPISTRVDPRGRYYGKIESVPLTPEETVRGIMAYKKINAYSESTVLQLLNDLLQGAVELTALDGKTRTIGQMLRVYMSLEGSFDTSILSPSDKQNLKVRVQLLKDMKYPVDPTLFSLSPKVTDIPAISAVHYSGQTGNEDAIMFGRELVITGRNLDKIIPDTNFGSILTNADTGASMDLTDFSESYTPSYGAIVIPPTAINTTIFPGAGPWKGIYRVVNTDESPASVIAERPVTVYPAA